MSSALPDRAIILFKSSASITIPRHCSIERISSQLQPFTNKFLYVLNGGTISYYDSLDDVPPGNRRLETDLSKPSNEYYIRDLNTSDLLCCFDLRLCERLLHGKPKEKKSPNDKPRISSDPIAIPGMWTPLSDDRILFSHQSTGISPITSAGNTPILTSSTPTTHSMPSTPLSAPSSLENRHHKIEMKPKPPYIMKGTPLETQSFPEHKETPKPAKGKTIDISSNIEKATSVTTFEHL